MLKVLACLGCGKWAYDAKVGCESCGALPEQLVFMGQVQAEMIRSRYLSLAIPSSTYSEEQQQKDMSDLFG